MKDKEIFVEIDKDTKIADSYEPYACKETKNSIFLHEVRGKGTCEECGVEKTIYFLKPSNQSVGICKDCFREYEWCKGIHKNIDIPENERSQKFSHKLAIMVGQDGEPLDVYNPYMNTKEELKEIVEKNEHYAEYREEHATIIISDW